MAITDKTIKLLQMIRASKKLKQANIYSINNLASRWGVHPSGISLAMNQSKAYGKIKRNAIADFGNKAKEVFNL